MSEEAMAYIGRMKCGCLVAAVVDVPDRPQETAKDVAEFIASGLTIERVTCQYVRETRWGCHCQASSVPNCAQSGAGEGNRTPDQQLGKG